MNLMLIITACLIVLGIIYISIRKQIKKAKNAYGLTWNFTYNTLVKKPLLIHTGNKPLVIKNYKKIIYDKIRKSLINSINSRIYDSFLINRSYIADVSISYHEENFVPLEYKKSFDEILKEVVVDLVKEYESEGYDIELSGDTSGFQLKIIYKI